MKFYNVFIIFFLVLFFYVNIYASDLKSISDYQTITVDEALEIAVNYNRELIESKENLSSVKDNYDDAVKDLRINPDSYYSLKVQIKELENTLNNYDKNTQKTKDILKYNITKLFVDIINAQNDIDIQEKNVSLLKKELDISDIKYQRGILSKSDFDTKNAQYIKSFNSFQNKKIELDNLFIDINKIMGVNLSEKYSPVVDLVYSEIGDVDIDEKFKIELDNNINILEQKQNLDVSEYEQSTYIQTTPYLSKISKQNDISSKKRDIKDYEAALSESLNKLYKDILNKEADIKLYYEQLDSKYKELDILNIKLSLGKALQLDVDKTALDILEIKNNIQKSKFEHQLFIMQFDNLNLL